MRRTTSIDASWPDGLGKTLHLSGRARDIRTPESGGRPVLLAEDRFEANLKPDRTILSIEADPPRPALSRLAGVAGGGGLRRALAEIVPEEKSRATPLYLILLSEVWRWTDDDALVRHFKDPALKALSWIEEHGDLDGDGFVEYAKRSETGLDNQSWKDSGDSQRFHDGRYAEPPIAPVEVQGYVFQAKLGIAEVARQVWREPDLADRLEAEAGELRKRFDQAFWIEDDGGGYYALALDGEKEKVDARCSNMGHLLWSGIVLPERVGPLVDELLSESLWSGWGIRTMGRSEAAYNPISYHNGTVWPHDTSIAAWGLARHGYVEGARRIARALIEAAGHFDWSLPEVFAGYARDETPFPIAYPTAARPQAWAAGTPILLVRVLLGIEPDRARQRLVSTVEDELPSWLEGLRVEGVRAFGRNWVVSVDRGRVTIAEGV